MDLTSWLKRWFSRHPLKSPTEVDRATYTTEVMARVRALGQPAPSVEPVRVWLPWPRLALTVAAVAAGALLVFGVEQVRTRQLAQQIGRDAEVLIAVDPAEPTSLVTDDTESVAEDVQTTDLIVLAESEPSDDAWIEQTMQLLDELDEEAPEEATRNTPTEDDWLQEFQQVDESELSASS